MSSDTQNGFAFLEALTSDIAIESLGLGFDGESAHTGLKVRPSTSGNLPSTLQLLPGQSFYVGKTTLSLVPEEHRDLFIDSTGLPDSNFDTHNQQISQIGTPEPTARVGRIVMETPMPHKDQESEKVTPTLEQIARHAISGRKDSRKWPQSPLKRQVMRTVRDASKHGHPNLQPEVENEDEHTFDATTNEPDRPSTQPEVKTEVEDVARSTAARPMEQGAVELEDTAMAEVDLNGDNLEKPEALSTLNSQVHPEGHPRGLSYSPILGKSKSLSSSPVRVPSTGEPEGSSHSRDRSKPLPSSVAQVHLERRPEPSGRSPILSSSSDSIPQLEDDLDGPVRKKTKTAEESHEALAEDSQDSLQDVVISVKRGLPTPTDHPVFTEQASSKFQTPSTKKESHSRSANEPRERSSTSSTEPKHLNPSIDSDSRPHLANEPPSEHSIKSTNPKPRTPLSRANTFSASPSSSLEPSSSLRSIRSSARIEHNSSSFTTAGTRILFASPSSAGDSKPFLKFLSNKGVKKVLSVHDCTVLCVGKELKKTSKLILAVLLGKDIITDSWVTDSVKGGDDLLSVVGYVPRDPKKEAEWGISLDKAIYRGKQGLNLKILQEQTIIFTPSLKKELGRSGFDELKEIVKCAGAKNVSSTLPKKNPEGTPSTIVIATDDTTEMRELQKLGWKAYLKDIISLSILRGNLDLESDEFLIKEQKKQSGKRKR